MTGVVGLEYMYDTFLCTDPLTGLMRRQLTPPSPPAALK